MKLNYIKSIFSFLLLLCVATSLQSCKDDEDEILFGDLGSNITLKYGVPYKVLNLPEISDDTLVLPGDIYSMGAIVEGGCVRYEDGTLQPYAIGKCVLKFYKGKRDNIIKTINIEVIPNYDVDGILKEVNDNLTLKYHTPIQLINIPEISEDESIYDFLRTRGIDLEITCKNRRVQYDNKTGQLIPNYLGDDIVTVSFDGGATIYKTITVNVVPNYEITMKSGETKSIADIIGENPEGYVTADNDRIANVTDGSIYAYQAGSTYIYVNGKAIGVTVSAYDGEALFSHPYMSSLASPDQIKAGMKAYTLSSETSQKIDGLNYIILTYAPFDNCKSISYYIRDTGWQRLAYARIDTGKSSNDVFGWLLRDYSPYFVRNNILYFEQPSGTYSDWRVYPVDGKWSTLELKFP